MMRQSPESYEPGQRMGFLPALVTGQAIILAAYQVVQ